MDQDMSNLFAETVELTAVAEKLRDEADGYRSLATYAERRWAEAVNENAALRREVARLRKLLLAEDPRRVDDAFSRWNALRIESYDSLQPRRESIARAMVRLERIERCEPAFGPASLCEPPEVTTRTAWVGMVPRG